MGNELENQKNVIWPEERLIKSHIRYILDLNGQLFVFENVPARVNPITGEQFFAPATVRRIQQVALSSNIPVRTVEVAVYEFGT